MATRGKIIVLTAPSGSGKTTLAKMLMAEYPIIRFSVSATTRSPRIGEVDGKDYFFISREEFLRRIDAGDFLEHEEFYGGSMYGTLKSHVENELNSGYFILLDIEVKGASNIKRHYGDDCLSIFVMPPSIEILQERLLSRGTETTQSLSLRLSRAQMELDQAQTFDAILVNDTLDQAYRDLRNIVLPILP
jgi:guanylate kinase